MNWSEVSIVLLVLAIGGSRTAEAADNRPLIGVLMQECWSESCSGNRYIAASYVKYLESAGARVVPVFTDRDQQYYEKIINATNGMLFPGGGQYLNTSVYAKAGQMIWNLTYGQKDFQQKYPIWGTCLGFELLAYLLDNNQTFDECNATNVANNLTMEVHAEDSRLFKDSGALFEVLKTQEVTYNHHKRCLSNDPNKLSDAFKAFFKVLSTSQDKDGLTYVSTVEANNDVPVFGVQWHPEKNAYEFALSGNTDAVPHSEDAVRVGQYMANFFVSLARERTPNRTGLNLNEESDMLIYNYQPQFSGRDGKSEFTQIYVFNSSHNNWLSTISSCICLIVVALSAIRDH